MYNVYPYNTVPYNSDVRRIETGVIVSIAGWLIALCRIIFGDFTSHFLILRSTMVHVFDLDSTNIHLFVARSTNVHTLDLRSDYEMYYVDSTPRLEVDVRAAGILTDVGTSMTISIYDTHGNIKVNKATMTKSATGMYYYKGYTILSTDVPGKWYWKAYDTTSAEVIVDKGTFEVEI